MKKELWKPIKGYESKYQVSTLGRIRNIRLSKILSGGTDRYKSVTLYRHSIQKTFPIHKIVVESFIGKRKQNEEVNHIDGNKWNNAVSNLEYTTRQKNIIHAYKNGLNKKRKHGLLIKDGIGFDFFKICDYLPFKPACAFLTLKYKY